MEVKAADAWMKMQQATPRQDRDSRRESILDVAQEIFLEEGYGAASMSTIAARLGGSKGTLYNYFKSKEDLFEACVRRHCVWQQEAMFRLGPQGEDVREALVRLGRTYLSIVLNDYSLRNFRMIAAEAERSPAIGRAFYEAGPQKGAARLAEFLEGMAGNGLLDIPDPLAAAHQFVGLCQNRLLKARLCGYAPEPDEGEITREVEQAADTFLRAFGTERRG